MDTTYSLTAANLDAFAKHFGLIRPEGVSDEDFRRIIEVYYKEQFMMQEFVSEFHSHFKAKQCECGAEKVKAAGHSTWCSKYKD